MRAYERLKEYGTGNFIGEFWVPEMKGFNDELMAIEMDLLGRKPYIVDFAKVMFNRGPEFTPEQFDEAARREAFGDNWPRARWLLGQLESLLIFYLDPNTHNIVFPDDDSSK